jgi:hypothetical protein
LIESQGRRTSQAGDTFHDPSAGDLDDGSQVTLDLPASPELLVLARMAAGVVGARCDLGIEDIDDLRLAVDELCLVLLSETDGQHGRLRIRFSWASSAIEVACTLESTSRPPQAPAQGASQDDGDLGPLPRELSRQILSALVDDFELNLEDGATRGWIRKSPVREHPDDDRR